MQSYITPLTRAGLNVGLPIVQISDCCRRSVEQIYADTRWPVECSSANLTDIRIIQVKIPDIHIYRRTCVHLKQIIPIQILSKMSSTQMVTGSIRLSSRYILW